MKNSKKSTVLVIAAIVLTLIIVGTTYAWFSYARNGNVENSITSGNVMFKYKEGSRSISLNDALPMTDEQGKKQTNYFDFEVSALTNQGIEIPYYITVKRKTGSDTNLDSYIKVYLTKVTGTAPNEVEEEVELVPGQTILKFSQLGSYTNSQITIPASEKALYNETVPVNSSNYNVKYRLRMWIDTSAEFIVQTPTEAWCEDNETEQPVATINSVTATEENCTGDDYTWHPADVSSSYPYEDSTYTLTVNVYAEGQSTVDNRLAPGLYDSNDNLITSWDDLVANNDISVNNNVIVGSNENLEGKLVIKRGITEIATVAFIWSKLASIDIPSTVTQIGYSFPGAALENIVVEEGNTVYDSRNNCNAVIETATNTLILGSANTVIPSTVTTIGGDAFNRNSALTSIVIPDTVTTINGGAFYECSNLTTVTLSNNLTRLDGTFQNCNISSITIPSSINYIANRTFDNNPLTSVTFVDPNGWTASYYIGSGGKDGDVPSADLANTATAATYLKETYLWYNLSKSTS